MYASALSAALTRRGHVVDYVSVAPHWRWHDLLCYIVALDGAPSRADICDAWVLEDPVALDAWLGDRDRAVVDDEAPRLVSETLAVRGV